MNKDAMLAAMMFGGGGGGLPDASEASVGDVLTKGEDGIGWSAPSGGGGGGVMRVEINGTSLDKTWQEISDCFSNGGYAYVAVNPFSTNTTIMPITQVGGGNGTYAVSVFVLEDAQSTLFICSSPDEYPVLDDSANN